MRAASVARLPQRNELSLERTQRLNPLADKRDVAVQEVVHFSARLVRLRGELQELSNLWERNVQGAAVPNEIEPRQVSLFIGSVAGRLTSGLFEKSLAFVEPNRLRVARRPGCQFAYFHVDVPTA